MNSAMAAPLQPMFVVISLLIAMIGSFVTLTAAKRIKRLDGTFSLSNTGAAGIALGAVVVWSAHFIGMMGLKLDAAVSYSLLEVGFSLVLAVVASTLALGYVARNPGHGSRLLRAGALLGLAFVVLHHIGMNGLRFGGAVHWSWGLVLLSAVLAVVAATAALWLASNTTKASVRAAAAIGLGLAFGAMHFTGMAAAKFVYTAAELDLAPEGFGLIAPFDLHTWVTIGALGVAVMILVDQLVQAFQAEPTA